MTHTQTSITRLTHVDTGKLDNFASGQSKVAAIIHYNQWKRRKRDIKMTTLVELEADVEFTTMNVVNKSSLEYLRGGA
jgi:hypothetical protein